MGLQMEADETRKIVKAKARLVAKGFKQKHGVDYLETFSPTANAASIRLIVALACKYDLELLHFDICLLYTSPSPRDKRQSRMPSSA